jgi:transcriptional regulator of nitric oxide reductase
MPVAILLLAAVAVVAVAEQPRGVDPQQLAQLKKVLPSATTFHPKAGEPPHFKGFAGEPSPIAQPVGYAFWTTELQPLERGYDGPIKMLVGMDSRSAWMSTRSRVRR